MLTSNENNEINENDDYNNKILNESKNSTLGYIGKKMRNYSSFKNLGLKEIQRLIEIKNKVNNSNGVNCTIINKNKTAFRSQDNSNNIKCINFERNKKYSRSRFNFIKRSLGFEEKKESFTKNDSNNNINIKKNISNINDDNNNNNNNNISNKENDDDGCNII